ncbi:MAG: hypothetical protein U5K75_07245 [Ahrensia sp.]|nr:hypothetical protein [Ahrensia sp.]
MSVEFLKLFDDAQPLALDDGQLLFDVGEKVRSMYLVTSLAHQLQASRLNAEIRALRTVAERLGALGDT